jgi:tRNA (guanine-N(7)-)-methyltransferase subunit TRM82
VMVHFKFDKKLNEFNERAKVVQFHDPRISGSSWSCDPILGLLPIAVMSPRMPYQCMVQCGNLLIAARGSSIDSFRDGSLLSTWKCPSIQAAARPSLEVTTKLVTQHYETSVEITTDSAPPAKKRKLSTSGPAEAKSATKEGGKKQNSRSDAVRSGLEAPAVIALAITKERRHVIAVTGEDKSIRVFENVQEDGVHRLKQLSQR